MSTNARVEYHIEIGSLRDYFNSLIEHNQQTPISAAEMFNSIKNAVLSSEIKPFLRAPNLNEKNPYYEKYLRMESEVDANVIPDFFSTEGDFYDLDRKLNISLENTNGSEFKKLFFLKMIELKNTGGQITDFLHFQLFDNFFGNRHAFAVFLWGLLEKGSNSSWWPEIDAEIRRWLANDDGPDSFIEGDSLETDLTNEVSPNKDYETVEVDGVGAEDFLAKMRNSKIEGKFTNEEIMRFFSFLYLEKGPDKNPFLCKEAVDQIFSNGLVIPNEASEIKFKLNCDLRYPKTIINYAIHTFYVHNSLSRRDKQSYLIFIGSYIEEYSDALKSKKQLNNLTSNITGAKPTRCKINWDKYLPERN